MLAVIFPLYRIHYRRRLLEERKKILEMQFVDGMQSMAAALLSGFSVENAWKEAERELRELHGADAYMTRELQQVNRGVAMNQPVEKLLYEFALRSGCEDILDFAEVFLFAKRSGGNYAEIMHNTSVRIREKNGVEQEIAAAIAGKKMEQKVMNVVPVFLLAYLKLTAADFLAPLYDGLLGFGVMSFAFAVYLGALILSQKMTDIRI